MKRWDAHAATGCPSEQLWDRALTDGPDQALSQHLAVCSRCRGAWQEHQDLVASAREATTVAPAAVSSLRMRNALLDAAALSRPVELAAKSDGTSQVRGRRFSSIAAIAAMAAAMVLAVGGWAWWTWSGSAGEGETATATAGAGEPSLWGANKRNDTVGESKAAGAGLAKRTDEARVGKRAKRATVMGHGEAEFMHVREGDDEILRLVEGTLSVRVSGLGPQERFRVVTGLGVVEVRGTVFDVSAKDDRLVAVTVVTGRVDLTWPSGETVSLGPDGRWTEREVGDSAGASQVIVKAGPAKRVSKAVSVGATRRKARPSPVTPKTPSVRIQEPAKPLGPGATSSGLTAAPAVSDSKKPVPKVATPSAVGAGRFKAGWQAFKAKDYAAAEAAFAEMLAKGGALAEDAAFWRSVALKRMGRGRASAIALAAFLKRFPGSARHGEAAVMLGWHRLRAGDKAGALKLFERGARDASARVRKRAAKGLEAAK